MAAIDALFESVESEILTEEIKLELAVLFESQVNEAIKAKELELQEANTLEIKEFKAKLVETIDTYLEYFSEKFLKDNIIPITESVKLKTAERIMKTFDGVMKDFAFQLDEKKISSDEKLIESKKEINKLTCELIESKKQAKDLLKTSIVLEASTKLSTDVQKEKLIGYAKTLEFDELFKKKTNTFVKTILEEDAKKSLPTQLVTEEKVIAEETKPKTAIDDYLNNL